MASNPWILSNPILDVTYKIETKEIRGKSVIFPSHKFSTCLDSQNNVLMVKAIDFTFLQVKRTNCTFYPWGFSISLSASTLTPPHSSHAPPSSSANPPPACLYCPPSWSRSCPLVFVIFVSPPPPPPR